MIQKIILGLLVVTTIDAHAASVPDSRLKSGPSMFFNLQREVIAVLTQPAVAPTADAIAQQALLSMQNSQVTINPNLGIFNLSFNGIRIQGTNFSISPDGKYVIIYNFKMEKGDSVVTSDRVAIERSQIKDGKVGSLDAVNLNLKSNENTVRFGWAQISTAKDPQSQNSIFTVTSSQINVSENGQSKFATKSGPTGLEAVHTTVELLPSSGAKLSLSSQVGFVYVGNAAEPGKGIKVESLGGSLINADLKVGTDSQDVTFKFQSESGLRVYDPAREHNIALSGSSKIQAIENRSNVDGQVLTANYVVEADELQIDRYTRGEKVVVLGLATEIETNKKDKTTEGTIAGDYGSSTTASRSYQIYKANYHFKKDHFYFVDELKSDKAIYISDRHVIEVEGNVNFNRTRDLQSREQVSYLSGDKATYYRAGKGTAVFYKFEATNHRYPDRREVTYATAKDGVIAGSNKQVKLDGVTQFMKETNPGDQITKYSLVNSEVISAEQNENGSKRLFSLAHTDFYAQKRKTVGSETTDVFVKGDDLYFEDQANGHKINAKNVTVVSNRTKTADGTKKNYAVELGEGLLEGFNKNAKDYILTNSTVLYEVSDRTEEKKGNILVKDLTGEIDGYKLSMKINNPEDALNGKTVDIYFNKNKEIERYSIKNDFGIVAAEKDGKKIVWTGGNIDVYKDGTIKLVNLTGTKMLVSSENLSGQIQVGQASIVETGGTQSLNGTNISASGKNNKGETGVFDFSKLEILKNSGIKNLTAENFSAILGKLDPKTNRSVSITGEGAEGVQVDGVSRGLTIRNGEFVGTDNNKNQNVKIQFSDFSGSQDLSDKSRGITLQQGRVNFSETSEVKQITGEMNFGKLISLVNKDKDTSIVEVKDMKLLVVDANKNRSLSGDIGWAKSYRDSGVNFLDLNDLSQVNFEDTKHARKVLFNGKRMAHIKNEDGGEILVVEQGQIQATNSRGVLTSDIKALTYFRDNKTDLRIIKEADLKGNVVYDGRSADFQLNAKDIRFVSENVVSGQTRVRYYGFEPTANDSHVELKIDHGPISIEIKGAGASVQMITDKSMGKYLFIGQATGGDTFKAKAGPFELRGHNSNNSSRVLVSLTAIGTQHQVLLKQIAGLTNEMPITKNLSFNQEGFLKFHAWIAKSVAIQVSYSAPSLTQSDNMLMQESSTAKTLIFSVVKKMESETRYGIDVGMMGASALAVTTNDRCAMRIYNQCLGSRMVIPMTAYLGLNRCREEKGRTLCTNIGATYDLTSRLLTDNQKQTPGVNQVRAGGGANLVLGSSFVTDSGIVHQFAATVGRLRGFSYQLIFPVK